MLAAVREGFVQGDEVLYVGQERTPRVEPFNSAVEIWVEALLLPAEGDYLYLFSCRMPDGTWEMGQLGNGRDFKAKR
jgi:hypothetical protein